MKVRAIKESDFVTVCEWYAKRKWPRPAVRNIIPSNGCIAEFNGTPVACVWLYLSNSSLALIEWVCTNPDIPWWQGIKGLRACTEWIKDFSKACKPEINCIMHITKNDKLASFYEKKLGFKNFGKENVLCWRQEFEGEAL